MTTKTQYTQETLPEVLTAAHISAYLGISRRRIYELFQMTEKAGGIRNFDVGGSKRVMKNDLFSWINTKIDSKSKRTG